MTLPGTAARRACVLENLPVSALVLARGPKQPGFTARATFLHHACPVVTEMDSDFAVGAGVSEGLLARRCGESDAVHPRVAAIRGRTVAREESYFDHL